jgi:transcriptional regulator of heat shock response
MTLRREAILDAIIREYVESAEPVGSLTLVAKFDFPFSPATIRAEMAWLEEEGYIYQPHTSAGRIPTEKGYRHFVNLVLSESKELVAQNEIQVQRRILHQHMKYEKLLDMAAKSLADLTGNVGIVGLSGLVYSHGLTNLFRQPEFIDSANVIRASEILDRMHELVAEIPDMRNPLVYIGSESPIGKTAGCSLVVSGFETPYMSDGRLAVLGPTRMSYPRVIGIVEEVKDLLESWRR